MADIDIETNSPQQTISLGRRIGAALKGGETICLIGPLGSGKTHLVKGIAAGATGCPDDQVNSPTFVLVNEYTGRLDVYHIDAYRLETTGQFDMLGFDDMCYNRSVVLIEWADKIESALGSINYIKIFTEHIDAEKRRVRIKNAPAYLKV